MSRLHAATWIHPHDEVDRGNVLGAAVVTCERLDRDISDIVEGVDRAAEALAAARRTGVLVVPAFGRVMPGAGQAPDLMRRAQGEGWRLLLLDAGADSTAPSGDGWLRLAARMAAMGDVGSGGPTPPAVLRHRVASGDEPGFLASGLLHVECFEDALSACGIAIAGRVLEWGAGCGRMTMHLVERAPHARLVAADTDAEAIAWVGEHLPVEVAALPVLPPTSFADDAFDLVVGHSVFSHLSVEAQDRWLAELARVTRPGAHVAVSFNGPAALSWHREHPLVDVPQSVAMEVERAGVAVWGDDGWEGEFYDGYHTTFHRHAYVREHWATWFDVVAIHPTAAMPIQDIAVLRARAPGARL